MPGVPIYLPRLIPAPWMADAACKGMDPDVFFPGRGESTDEARAVCAECPVQPECLEHALSTVERLGFWGGMSERERRKLRRERNQAGRGGSVPVYPCGTVAAYKRHIRASEAPCAACRDAHARDMAGRRAAAS